MKNLFTKLIVVGRHFNISVLCTSRYRYFKSTEYYTIISDFLLERFDNIIHKYKINDEFKTEKQTLEEIINEREERRLRQKRNENINS